MYVLALCAGCPWNKTTLLERRDKRAMCISISHVSGSSYKRIWRSPLECIATFGSILFGKAV